MSLVQITFLFNFSTAQILVKKRQYGEGAA